MKMIYRQKSKKKSKRVFVVLAVIVLFVVVSSFLISKVPETLSNTVRFVGTPFWQAEIFISNHTHFISNFFRSRNAVVTENDALKSELDLYREQMLDYETLKSEHAKLLAEYGREGTQNKIIATVLVRPPQTPFDTLILDVGSNEGVALEDVVYSVGGVILGTVTDVSAHNSNVTLFSRTNLMTPAIFERSNLSISIRGLGGGSFEAQVPQESDIVKDDILIMPTLVPSPVGVVSLVESSVKSAFKRVLIQSPTNISYTRFVFIGKKI